MNRPDGSHDYCSTIVPEGHVAGDTFWVLGEEPKKIGCDIPKDIAKDLEHYDAIMHSLECYSKGRGKLMKNIPCVILCTFTN